MGTDNKPLEYEAKELTIITQPGSFNFADRLLLRHARDRWNYSQETREYNPAGFDDESDLEVFVGAFDKLRVIVACAKKGVFKSVVELVDLLLEDSQQIEVMYKAAIEANPTLGPDFVKELEPGAPNPLG